MQPGQPPGLGWAAAPLRFVLRRARRIGPAEQAGLVGCGTGRGGGRGGARFQPPPIPTAERRSGPHSAALPSSGCVTSPAADVACGWHSRAQLRSAARQRSLRSAPLRKSQRHGSTVAQTNFPVREPQLPVLLATGWRPNGNNNLTVHGLVWVHSVDATRPHETDGSENTSHNDARTTCYAAFSSTPLKKFPHSRVREGFNLIALKEPSSCSRPKGREPRV